MAADVAPEAPGIAPATGLAPLQSESPMATGIAPCNRYGPWVARYRQWPS